MCECKECKEKIDKEHMDWMVASDEVDFLVAALMQIENDVTKYEGAILREKIIGTVRAALKEKPPCPPPLP